MTTRQQDELLHLQRDYLSDVREKVSMIRQHGKALSARSGFKTSFPVLLYLSHQLKGSGGTIGFPVISDVAQTLRGELNQFMDDLAPRPSPGSLSRTVLGLAERLEAAVDDAEASLLKAS